MLTPVTQLRKQHGSIVLYGIIALVLVAGTGAVVYSYNSAIKEAEKLRAENTNIKDALQTQLTENDNLAKENKRVGALLAARQKDRLTQQELEGAINAAINKAFQNDPKAKDWANTPIPESIPASLRSTDVKDSNKPETVPAGKPSINKASPTVVSGSSGN